MTRSDLKQLIADNQTKKAIQSLLEATEKLNDSDLQNEVIQQSARFNDYLREKAAGTKSQEHLDIQKANIDAALMYIVDKIPASAFSPTTSAEAANNLTTQSSNNPGAESPTHPNIWPPLLVGVGFALLIFVTILLFPCPTGAQYVVFRILISLGAAGIAAVIPGFLELKYRKEISAGGALAVFVLVYLFNPALIDPSERCNSAPFGYTVSLQAPELPNYPSLQKAVFQIKLDNRWDEAGVDEFGDADFKGIPGEFMNKGVPCKLKSDFYELLQDTLYFEGNSTTLAIRPNGALGQIRGNVRTGDGSAYISGVEIRIENSLAAVLTDSTGYFEINVPIEQQREKYSLTASKPGFNPYTMDAYPSGSLDIRLSPKK